MVTKTTEGKNKAVSAVKGAATKQTTNIKTKATIPQKLASTGIVPNERLIMIAEAAYYRAERRGFEPGDQLKDWLEAEAEVDAWLSKVTKKDTELTH